MNLVTATWRISNLVCALADNERHLGHLMRVAGHWQAWDATQSNAESNGFLPLGSFASLRAAKQAVEHSVATGRRRLLAGAA